MITVLIFIITSEMFLIWDTEIVLSIKFFSILQAPVVILKERDNKFVQPAAEILCVIMVRVTMSLVRYLYTIQIFL